MDNSIKAMAPDIADSLNSNNDTDILLKEYNLNEKLLENASHQLSEEMNEFHKIHQYENIMTSRERPLEIMTKMDMFHDIDAVTNNSVQSMDPQKRKRRNDSLVEDSVESKKFNNSVCDEKKINLRKNIRDVMDEAQLDTDTLAAQREESERLARVAEQQKIIREYQRQNAVNRQFVRTQNKVLSLLKSGNTYAKPTEISENKQVNEGFLEECQNVINKDTCSTSISTSSNEDTVSEIKSDVLDCDSKPDIELYPPTSSTTSVTTEQVASDIVTIEDSSSEDDCIMLSDDEEEDFEDEPEDDPNNSGLHVKDAYNVPDEHGRVVVNVGHPEGEEDIFIAPQIAKTIKPHQIGGVRFLFDNIIESTKRFKHSSGFGCILAHSMGLGKTLQIVCFCDIFLRHTSSKTVLCVMPINTLQNWVSEFNMWTPKQSIDHESIRPREFDVYVLNDQHKTLSARAKVVLKWSEQGGVLLIGYELFRLLALKLMPTRRRRGKNANLQNSITEANARLMETIHSALVKPGPDLVICDEGHRIKNAHAGISLALKQIRTRRRIVLTGYPLQNNLLEYWCMVDFVRPNYLGTRTEFCNMFERPIQNGQCIDSTPEDIKLMRYRAHVLHSLLVGFVQRRSHMVLQQTLPQKLEYVILTRMTTFQRQLYQTFMNDVVRSKAVPNPLKAFAVCCKIWNHPDVLYNFLKKRETDLDLEIDDNEVVNEPVQKITPNITEEVKDKTEKLQPSPIIKNEADTSTKNLLSVSTVINEDDPSAKRNLEIACSNQSFNGMYYPTNYYHQTVDSTYSTETEENNYWQEPNVPYFFYNSLPSSLSFPVKPDYVGQMDKNLAEKSINETENITNSSEIVDLDTQEIKTVETDIDINQKLIMKSNACGETKKDVNVSLDNSVSNIKDSNFTNSDETKSLADTKVETVSPTGAIEKEHSQKSKGDDGIPYEWAIELMKKYEPGLISSSPKMEIFFCILNESIQIGDRVLLFSQSLLTLNLIEIFLNSNIVPGYNTHWTRNVSYFRLDGSTTSQEREKLVNEFNSNYNVKLFLISTRAGSLGINLVGANRVIVFDASWNPCHDTQAVYRIYRYGQKKSCYVYRIVMDKCLEKKIYDRQIKKQGMSDRVVDECNPDAHLSMKDVTNLCHDYDDDLEDDNKNTTPQFVQPIESFEDVIIQKIIEQYKSCLSKEPFHHESLLIDRKEKKLSQAEKRQAHRGYELEKKAASRQTSINSINKIQYRIVRNDGTVVNRPVASIRPMQTITKTQNSTKSGSIRSTRWIPAEVWQRQGMTAQEMTLPLDVVIPTNSNDKSNIVLRAGQRVMVLKSAKGIYMQLDSGKIIAIRTSNKATEESKVDKGEVIDITSEADTLPDDKTNSIKNKPSSAGENLGLKLKDKDPVDNMKEDQIKAQINNEVSSINKTKEIQKKNVFVHNTNNQIEKEKQSNNSKIFKTNVNKDNSMEAKNESLSMNNKDNSNLTFSPKSYEKSVSGSIAKNKPFTIQSELQENTVMNNSMSIDSSESQNMHYEKDFRKQFYKTAPSNINNSNSLFAARSINNETYKRDERLNKPSTFQPLPTEKQMSQSTNLFRGKNQNHGAFNSKNNDTASNYFIQHPKGKQFVAPNKSSYASSQKGDNRSMPEIIQNPFNISCETNNESKPQTVSTSSSTDYLPVKSQAIKLDQPSRTEIAPVSQQPFPQHQQQSHSKFHLHVPHYDLQHTQFSNSIAPLHLGVPQCINPESNLAPNAFFSSRDVNNYSSHYDTIYNSNNMGASCDYSPQYPEYSYAAYNHPQYHSQLHTNTYGGAASTAIAANPYNLHWSPLVTSTPLNEQYNTMYSSAYTQNGAPSNQWCNP